jgi:outer membrane cobalamin receptor
MRHILFFITLFLLNGAMQAQTIKGIVTGKNNEPLTGANIYLKESYDGATSDTNGKFEFQTSLSDTAYLMVSFMGYENYETLLIINKHSPINLNITLKEKNTEIKEVVITAGTFVAGDKKRGIQMSARDILTTANSNGDIPSALATLPGVQMVGEEGAIFVRGGEKYETKTYVDGMLVTNPYTSKVPDLPMRGRFSPNIFTGVSFSSGGYSAEYGQALSSALILQSYSFPTKTFTSLSFMPFGTGISHTQKGDSSSLSVSVDYLNMKAYNSVIKQNVHWAHHPEDLQTTLMYRKKLKGGGLIKSFFSFSNNRLALNLPSYLAINSNTQLNLINRNIYTNTILSYPISSQWSVKAGISLNYDDELVGFENFSANTYNRAAQFKLTFQNQWTDRIMLKFGGEFNFQTYKQSYIRKDIAFNATMDFTSPLTCLFAEAEWKVTDKLFARMGSRLEYSGLIDEITLVPRLALAYKTGEHSQVSLAYGIFAQLPQDNYLKFNSHLSSEKAAHYILNYEYSRDNRLFRVEAYSKQYSQLVRYSELNNPDPNSYNNSGHGYAQGFEFFLRDQKTFKYGDYWISYTFLDTRKLYQDAPQLERPYLFSKHSLNVVGKYFVSCLHTQFGLTYQFASGRPYYQPENNTTTQHFTNDYHNISANFSYLTSILNCFTIIHFSVSNVFGFDNIYGYHFMKSQTDNTYTPIAVKSSAKRFFVIGVFITLGKNYITY